MSHAAINPTGTATVVPHTDPHAHAGNHHDPHLAHHFDTPEQQYASAKLGMWVFLGTEILMFGGLFCAYSVYRHNHPDVFAYAHQFLDRWLGAVNTVVLITSSLTMAWAVRSATLGNQRSLKWLMAVTILGGYVFLGIKSVEYRAKWQHVLFIGTHNQFRAGYTGPKHLAEEEAEKAAAGKEAMSHGLPGHADGSAAPGAIVIGADKLPGGPSAGPQVQPESAKEPLRPNTTAHEAPESKTGVEPQVARMSDPVSLVPPDPNAGTGDEAKIRPPFVASQSLAPKVQEEHASEMSLRELSNTEQERLYTFFGVYFFMTGLHGLHVVIGMSLIMWVLLRASGPRAAAWLIPMIPASIGAFICVVAIIIHNPDPAAPPSHTWIWTFVIGAAILLASIAWAMAWVPQRRHASDVGEFGPTYFTPVDLVGLYWHLVDLIWIFLFPLLYLIH